MPSLAEIRSVLLKNKILNFVNVFSQFRHYPSSSQMLCAKSGCNLPSGKSGEDVQMLSICIFAIIIPLKNSVVLHLKKKIITQGCFLPSLVEIDLAVLEKLIYFFRCYLPLEKGTALYLKT